MGRRIALLAAITFLFALRASEAATSQVAPERARCRHYTPLRQPFFGDLHVHTALSLDAATQGTRARPADAYRFARGEPLGIQPYDREGRALRSARIDRPLDFVAVTDHAEFLGELYVCETPTATGHDSPACAIFRRWPRLAFFLMNGRASDAPPVRYRFCGAEPDACRAAAAGPWQEIREAADAAYDRSDECSFTSFVAYEWTKAPGSRNLHRNVIFASAVVPELPASVFDAPEAPDLWRWIEEECVQALPGCKALAIPHNSNLSGGLMFRREQEDGSPMTGAYAERRAAFEPLVEVMQHKGDSECSSSDSGRGEVDELCTFEELPYDLFSAKFTPSKRRTAGEGSLVRGALVDGLVLQGSVGANPYRFGFVASTDTHLGTAGAVEESKHQGHGGAGRLSGEGLADDVEFNPGGLTVLWAEENTRESLFAAMQRREAFATSGPRFLVRFFGGWEYPPELCADPELAARGYAGGVPMGGDLPASPGEGAAPVFAIWAARDPGSVETPGGLLERLQVVKGWVENGAPRERVYDVAGRAGRGSVDERTCATSGSGDETLCTVWRDPDFDPAAPAVYYVRVLENPSCRWTTWACNAAGVRCDGTSQIGAGFEPCCDPTLPKTLQERAWTSPIWYTP